MSLDIGHDYTSQCQVLSWIFIRGTVFHTSVIIQPGDHYLSFFARKYILSSETILWDRIADNTIVLHRVDRSVCSIEVL